MIINCKSRHSLRYGTFTPEELAEMASRQEYHAAGLTDINTITGVYDFIKACQKASIKPIIGIEFRRNRANELLYIGYARNQEGFNELNKFLSYYHLNHLELPDTPPPFDHAYIVYPFSKKQARQLRAIQTCTLIYSTNRKRVQRSRRRTKFPLLYKYDVVRGTDHIHNVYFVRPLNLEHSFHQVASIEFQLQN